MASDKIKVVAPATNPHICYISRELLPKVKAIKENTNRSLYGIICASAGTSLGSKENIHKFKKQLKSYGYKNIGEWVEELIDMMYTSGNYEEIPQPKKREIKR